MGTLRKIGKAFAGFLFTLALLTTVSTYSLANFTQSDTIKDVVSNVLMNAPLGTPGTDFSEAGPVIDSLKENCKERASENVTLKTGMGVLTIKCSDVNSLSADNFREFSSAAISQVLYQKTYDCEFVECLRRGDGIMPLIVTKTAHDFYQQILVYLIIITVVLGALFVLAAEGIKSKLKSLGFSLLWSSVPFFLMSMFTESLVTSLVPVEIFSRIQPLIDTFFAPTFFVYVYLMVGGIALVVAGYLIKPGMLSFAEKK